MLAAWGPRAGFGCSGAVLARCPCCAVARPTYVPALLAGRSTWATGGRQVGVAQDAGRLQVGSRQAP
eukprot:8005118-Alexandrium_andersonii.AAC.1